VSHALRGAVTAWLALIALQAVTTKGGSGRLASFFSDVDRLIGRALDPTVPAIPDLRTGGWGQVTATTPYSRPADMPVPAHSPYPVTLGRVGGSYAN
jgi:hypothetical protein